MKIDARRAAMLTVACATAASSTALARPAGIFGSDCFSCHATSVLSGREVEDQLLNIVAPKNAEIPLGAFGDPDRGEGPLPTYTAAPGGSFVLTINITNPNVNVVDPHVLSVALKRVFTTDPDFQAGVSDKSTWLDDGLFLAGAMAPDNASTNYPADETGWTEHIDQSFLVPDNVGERYYTSSDSSGHDFEGPRTLTLDVSVPAGVLPGWYDLEISVAGNDGPGFYEDAHFYLEVIPTPGAAAIITLAIAGAAARRRR
jgi:hypothetical protein